MIKKVLVKAVKGIVWVVGVALVGGGVAYGMMELVNILNAMGIGGSAAAMSL